VLTTKNGIFTEEHLHKIMTGAIYAVKNWLNELHLSKTKLAKQQTKNKRLQSKIEFQATKISHLEKAESSLRSMMALVLETSRVLDEPIKYEL
jgi:hypothetical protein